MAQFDLESLIGGSIGDAFAKIVGVFKADPNKVLEAQTELAKIQADLQGKILDQLNEQIEVNKVEAASNSIFVAGWRPWIGWVCGTGLAIQLIIGPFATWIAALTHHAIAFPQLDMGILGEVLLAMLGLGGMRTYEKLQQVPGSKNLH